ncbi:MAG: glycosyltransferase family 39 protein [Endomicrobiales bacterium]|jgi:hypothetical protein
MEKMWEKTFWSVLAGTVIVKLILASVIPLTSDEAHFVLWGRYLSLGYFDHPPMIGWILHCMERISSAPVVLRLPAILFTTFIGYGISRVGRYFNPVVALMCGTLFLVSPFNVLDVIVTTDTPLLLFVFISGVCYFNAQKNDQKLSYYAISGIFLGLAFLSKYLSALLGFAYVIHWIISTKTKQRTLGICVLFACLMPFVSFNLIWNYYHGWPNIMFNVFNRNRSETFSWGKIATFIACQAYLITPPVLYYIFKRVKEANHSRDFSAVQRLWHDFPAFNVFIITFIVPLGIFGILSTKKVIGLHWPLSYYPFLYIVVGMLLSAQELKKSIVFMSYFTGAHLLIVAIILSLPLSVIKNNKNYTTIIIGMHPQKVLSALAPYGNEFSFATPSYADSGIIEFYLHRHVAVFGTGSFHARQDDFVTDFNTLSGKNILILRTSPPQVSEYAPYFQTLEINTVMIDNAPFYLVLGRNFNVEEYKTRVLSSIRDQFYRIPSWLPYKHSDFLDKYFPSPKK